MKPRLRLVLLDLDGTLVDTAPDLAAAANRMRIARGIEPLPIAELRPLRFARRTWNGRTRFQRYAGRCALRRPAPRSSCANTNRRCVWNPRYFRAWTTRCSSSRSAASNGGSSPTSFARFTLPLVQALNLSDRAACVVSGDTTKFSKPHPAPLLHALAAAAVDASLAIYVGDDQRDIDAGHAAGMRTVVASYGYLGNGVPYQQWGADAVIDSPPEILRLLTAIGRSAAKSA